MKKPTNKCSNHQQRRPTRALWNCVIFIINGVHEWIIVNLAPWTREQFIKCKHVSIVSNCEQLFKMLAIHVLTRGSSFSTFQQLLCRSHFLPIHGWTWKHKKINKKQNQSNPVMYPIIFQTFQPLLLFPEPFFFLLYLFSFLLFLYNIFFIIYYLFLFYFILLCYYYFLKYFSPFFFFSFFIIFCIIYFYYYFFVFLLFFIVNPFFIYFFIFF